MKNTMKKITITKDEAINLLPNSKDIHTFRQGGFALIGCDIQKKSILKTLNEHEDTIELTGATARNMNHGLVVKDETGMLFIETDEEKLNKFDPVEVID